MPKRERQSDGHEHILMLTFPSNKRKCKIETKTASKHATLMWKYQVELFATWQIEHENTQRR